VDQGRAVMRLWRAMFSANVKPSIAQSAAIIALRG
jgi:hypothetical protein